MSLLNLQRLKIKTEPRYNKKIINTTEEKIQPKDFIETIKETKPNSALIIGEGANINGTIKENNEISIQGTVEGDIECKDLMVGKSGILKGKIKTDSLSVEGNVEGELTVKGLLKLMASGTVSGKISYGSLQIHEGGKLMGELDYKDKKVLQEEFKDWKPL
jgi:cytoskeletal protein CcmA (bactofilin family)